MITMACFSPRAWIVCTYTYYYYHYYHYYSPFTRDKIVNYNIQQ